MNYKFTYKSRFERKNFNQRINKIFSDILFFLYGSRFFKKFKLDRNNFLKSHILYRKNRKIPKINQSTIPDNPNLKIYSVTFLDCIEIEDSHKLKSRLIKIVSKYKGGFLSEEPSKNLKKAFDTFDSSYKTTSWGNIFYNDTRNNPELDLIDGISYGYVKGSQSHFVITYTIYPSQKFQTLFRESLNAESTEESEILFKSFKQILKTKKLFTSIGYNVKQSGYWTEKLINEITFQFQSKVASPLKLGIFNKNDGILFPRITSFEYDPNEFNQYKNEIFHILKVSSYEQYNSSDVIFTLKDIDYSKVPSAGIELFIPLKSDEEKRNDQFNNVEYLSDDYIKAIAPFWVLMNVSSLSKQNIVDLRKKTFIYIRKNRVSLFLKKVIILKNKISLDWISFERLRKDFSMDIFKHQLDFHGIPNAFNMPWFKGEQPGEFKKDLVSYSKSTSIDIKETYEELLELFSHISEDNTMRANMRLQRFLFWFAILGVILATYSANSGWINSWIEYYLNNLGIKIPKVQIK